MKRFVMCGSAILTTMVSLSTAAFGDPICQAAKNLAAGKYAVCLQKAEQKLVLTGDSAKYATRVQRCETIFSAKWQAVTDRAGGRPACPEFPILPASFKSIIDMHNSNVTAGLSGQGLDTCAGSQGDRVVCSDNLAVCTADLYACDAQLSSCIGGCAPAPLLATGLSTCHDSSGNPISCAGTGQDGEVQAGQSQVFMDNGDGTISDLTTGLMWEKLSDDGSIHDWDNTYTFTDAINTKIAALNTAVFGGYNDWRLPNARELLTIVDWTAAASPAIAPAFNSNCVPSCSPTTCGCTKWFWHWTSSEGRKQAGLAYSVGFEGDLGYPTLWRQLKTGPHPVRAVRGG